MNLNNQIAAPTGIWGHSSSILHDRRTSSTREQLGQIFVWASVNFQYPRNHPLGWASTKSILRAQERHDTAHSDMSQIESTTSRKAD